MCDSNAISSRPFVKPELREVWRFFRRLSNASRKRSAARVNVWIMVEKNSGSSQNLRLIVGISGASGVAYGVRLLELLKEASIETHLVMTKAAEMTLGYETGLKARDVDALAHTRYRIEDIGAGIASGSFRTLGMIVAP